MRILVVVAPAFFFISNIFAQESKNYIVKAGEVPGEVLPAEALYVLPVFKEGTVYMRDGSASRQKLNYNIILDEMQFIGPKGDTLAIAEPAMIKSVMIDTLQFYYDKNYLQVIARIDSFNLAVKQILVQSPYRTRGGYDVPTATSSITTYGSITNSASIRSLQVKKDVQFEKDFSYFVSDKFSHFFKAEKKSFLAIFNRKKEVVQQFMNDNNINYRRQEDLKKLLKFCVYGD